MKPTETIRRPRILAAALLAGIVSATVMVMPAEAQHSICRTDPIVTMSDGTQVTMYTDISDDASDIQQVAYVLHAPKNVKVVNVQYDATYGDLENVSVVYDMHPGIYHTITTPVTGTPVTATAFAEVGGSQCMIHDSGSITNTTPHSLPNNFNC